MVPSRRFFTLGVFAMGVAAAATPRAAHAQWAVIDVEAILRAETQIQHAISQVTELRNQVTNQLAMLQGLKTDITGPIFQIAGQATQILQQAKGIGYGAQDIAAQFKQLYSPDFTGATYADTQKAFSDWRGYNDQALQDAFMVQNRISQDQPQMAAQVATAVGASQSAPGQTAAIQATNQLLATVSAQLTQLQNILITQSRAQQTFAAQAQAAQAAGKADSDRAWTYTPPASRVQNPGQL